MLDPHMLQAASGSLRSVEAQKQEAQEEEEDGRSDLLEAIRKGMSVSTSAGQSCVCVMGSIEACLVAMSVL